MAPIQCKIVGAKATITFQMYPGDTIREVKEQIYGMTNISFHRLTLRVSHERDVLENHRTLEEYRYRGEAVIHLDVTPLLGDPEFEILAGNRNHHWTQFKVRETTTVAELKNKIMTRWGIPTDKLTLIRVNLNATMEDSSPLSEYYISNYSTITFQEDE